MSLDNFSPSEAQAPTIVVAPGGLTSAPGLARLSRRLTDAGFSVVVMPFDAKGLEAGTAALLDLLASVAGAKILVGHGYGGMLITHAGCVDRDTQALVFVGALAPERGESAEALLAGTRGALIGGDAVSTFNADPAWKHLPAWFVYGEADETIPARVHAWMAMRAGAVVTTIVPAAGHDLIADQPVEVLRAIRQAVDATTAQVPNLDAD